jgi:hypothetical protein
LEDEARSLSTWTCSELARTLIRDRVVDTISASSVQRSLASEKLKPWRVHHWLSSKVPRDDQFRALVNNICDLYTRKLGPHERVLSLDEKTSLQPRTRTSRNRPARPGNEPILVEDEHVRKGALNLFAAFDTRTAGSSGSSANANDRSSSSRCSKPSTGRRQRRSRSSTCSVTTSASTTASSPVWLAAHLRFRMHFTHVHCSWMNQVEQWFSILQRQRLRAPDFADLADLEGKILAFIAERNEIAHPFNWTTKSFDKMLNGVDNPWIRRRPHWTDAVKAAA